MFVLGACGLELIRQLTSTGRGLRLLISRLRFASPTDHVPTDPANLALACGAVDKVKNTRAIWFLSHFHPYLGRLEILSSVSIIKIDLRLLISSHPPNARLMTHGSS